MCIRVAGVMFTVAYSAPRVTTVVEHHPRTEYVSHRRDSAVVAAPSTAVVGRKIEATSTLAVHHAGFTHGPTSRAPLALASHVWVCGYQDKSHRPPRKGPHARGPPSRTPTVSFALALLAVCPQKCTAPAART